MNRLLVALALCSALCRDAMALPAGRAWSPREEMTLPGYVYLAAPRLDYVDGVLRASANPQAIGSPDGAGFRWQDSNWTPTWRLGYGAFTFWPVIAPAGETHLIWTGVTPATEGLMCMARVFGDQLGPADTVFWSIRVNVEYDACVSPRRRWAAVNDMVASTGGYRNKLRVFYSDTSRIWRETTTDGDGSRGVTIAALDDTTALVVWASFTHPEGLQWGILHGTRWEPQGQLGLYGAIRPRLRPRQSGGFWLTWGREDPEIYMASYQDGVWSPPIRIGANYLVGPPGWHYAEDTEMSRDGGEYPVIAWDTQSPLSGGEVVVSFPTPAGYSLGEVIDGSTNGGLPSLIRDDNGDTWLTWWEAYAHTWYTHTYTKATASNLRVEGKGRRRSLAWTLSEPAPESWWAVFASRNDGAFEQVARVQAGDGVEMSWADVTPPAGRLHYRIRRECLDTRYRWESEPIAFPDIRPLSSPVDEPSPYPVLKRATLSAMDSIELEVESTVPGDVELSIFDLQGRRLIARSVQSQGERFRVPLAAAMPGLTPGVYFARIRDSAGRESNAVRFVLLR